MAQRDILICFFMLCVSTIECRGIQTRDDNPAVSQSSPLIELVSVERTSIGHEYNNFTVRLIKNQPEVRVEVFNFRSPIPQSVTEVQESGGVTTFTFTVHVIEDHQVVLQVAAVDRSCTQMYVLQNLVGDPKRQDDFGTLNFEIIPDGNVEYTPGTNAQFETVLTEHTRPMNPWSNPYIGFNVLDITSQQFLNIYDFDSLAEKTQRVLPNGLNETQVTVMTAERPVTGMFDVTYSIRGEPGDLVTEMMVTKARVLKPNTLEDVFPPSYVGFIEREQQHCNVGKDCTVNCIAVGNSLSQIRVSEIGKERIKPVPSATQPANQYPYTLFLWWQADANSPTFAGQMRKFQCDAKNNAQDHWVSQEIEVMYTKDASVDETRSNVTLEAEGNGTKATLTCVVNGGYPRPNMTFNLEYQYAHYAYVSPDSIIRLGGNEFLMLTVVTFDPNEGHGGYYHTPTGRLLSATCDTYQGLIYTSTSYDLPFFDLTAGTV